MSTQCSHVTQCRPKPPTRLCERIVPRLDKSASRLRSQHQSDPLPPTLTHPTSHISARTLHPRTSHPTPRAPRGAPNTLHPTLTQHTARHTPHATHYISYTTTLHTPHSTHRTPHTAHHTPHTTHTPRTTHHAPRTTHCTLHTAHHIPWLAAARSHSRGHRARASSGAAAARWARR